MKYEALRILIREYMMLSKREREETDLFEVTEEEMMLARKKGATFKACSKCGVAQEHHGSHCRNGEEPNFREYVRGHW